MDFEKLSNEELIKYIDTKRKSYDRVLEDMRIGQEYYDYKHDIKNKMRVGIGKNGKEGVITNLPNSQLLDNQYKRGVDQKVNYLFSIKPNIDGEDEKFLEIFNEFIDQRFLRTLNKIALDVYNKSIAWLYLYTDGKELKYKKMDSTEIIPIWKDNNEESLIALIRKYIYEDFEDGKIVNKEECHFFTDKNVKIFTVKDNQLTFEREEAYISKGNKYSNFEKIPFIYFKSNDKRPLVFRIKCLQDALNYIISNFQDNMLEDPRNTILVIKNYDGEDLGEFRRNMYTYGAIKVTTADGMDGGVETLTVNVNHENYESIVRLLKESIKENIRMIDFDNQKYSQAPNQLNLKSMYNDIELDANQLELEFTASFEHLYGFINQVYGVDGTAEINFKRNIMVNEESLVSMIRDSAGLLSEETLVANHPLVTDVEKELKQIKAEKRFQEDLYNDYGFLGDSHDEEA